MESHRHQSGDTSGGSWRVIVIKEGINIRRVERHGASTRNETYFTTSPGVGLVLLVWHRDFVTATSGEEVEEGRGRSRKVERGVETIDSPVLVQSSKFYFNLFYYILVFSI